MREIVIIILIFCFTVTKVVSEELEGTVVEVVDGNTFLLQTTDNESYKILLHGVDCPEDGQPYAAAAKARLESLLLKKRVSVSIQGKDRKGVRMGIVLIKGKIDPRNILLTEGLAWTAERYPQADLEKLREQAHRDRSGLWQEENPVPPWIYRRNQSILQPKSS